MVLVCQTCQSRQTFTLSLKWTENLLTCSYKLSLKSWSAAIQVLSVNVHPGKSYWRGKLSTVDLLVLTCEDQLLFIANIIFIFKKTCYLNEEVKCTEPSPLVSIPWLFTFWGFPQHSTQVGRRANSEKHPWATANSDSCNLYGKCHCSNCHQAFENIVYLHNLNVSFSILFLPLKSLSGTSNHS